MEPLQQSPQVQSPLEQGGLPEEMMRDDISSSIADVKTRSGALESKQIIGENMARDKKIELVRKIFSKMQEMGIDPNDPESIKGFLAMLNKQNPDLYILFESAMGEILPDAFQGQEQGQEAISPVQAPSPVMGQAPAQAPIQEPSPLGGQPGEVNLMDKYKSLQNTIMRGQ